MADLTPTQKTLRDIIRIFAFGFTYIEGETQINQAISKIKSLFKEKLKKRPELASMKQGMTCSQCGQNYHSEDIGFNSALTEIEKIIKEAL